MWTFAIFSTRPARVSLIRYCVIAVLIITKLTELYSPPTEQKGRKGAVPANNIDLFSLKSSLPTIYVIHLCIQIIEAFKHFIYWRLEKWSQFKTLTSRKLFLLYNLQDNKHAFYLNETIHMNSSFLSIFFRIQQVRFLLPCIPIWSVLPWFLDWFCSIIRSWTNPA